MSDILEPNSVEPISDQILPRLTRMLRAQGVRPGDRIPGETELSATLGVSRPAIREALVVLEAIGMLHARRGSGRVVQPVNFTTLFSRLANFMTIEDQRLLDLLFVRQILEVNMLPVAAPKLSSGAIERLEAITCAIETKAARGEYFAADDREFHLLLYSGLDNEVLNGILILFWATYERIDPARMRHSQRLEETAAHHRRILKAIMASDIRLAQHHLDTHFYDTAYVLSRSQDIGDARAEADS